MHTLIACLGDISSLAPNLAITNNLFRKSLKYIALDYMVVDVGNTGSFAVSLHG